MKRAIAATAALTVFALTVAVMAACTPERTEARPEAQAETAPDFSLADLQGQTVTLADYKGKVLFLNFWATWCPPCRAEIPDFVEVTTTHKAKGLEWDRVYLLSVNNYDFPSVQESDQYKGEKWFIHDKLNLEAECLAQLKAMVKGQSDELYMESGNATQEARISYASERLRLLYVGITRARENLIITWNSGRQGNSDMALPLSALSAYLENQDETA